MSLEKVLRVGYGFTQLFPGHDNQNDCLIGLPHELLVNIKIRRMRDEVSIKGGGCGSLPLGLDGRASR